MNLVYVNNNRLVTDSLTIAEMFDKEHARVLRDIRELGCSEAFRVGNFADTPYVNEQNGQTYRKYILTEQGFMILVMSYTGAKAFEIKETYIAEFDRMKDQLNKPQHALPQNYKEALIALVGQVEKTEQLEAKIEADKPLIIFAESLQVSKDSILIADLAKLLKQNGIEMGEKRLFTWLRAEGYLIKSGSEYNNPTQRSMELKIMEVKTGSRNGSDGTIKITRTTKITGKGQMYFINKFKNLQIAN